MTIEHPDHQDVNRLGELPRPVREERRELYGREPEPGGTPGIIEQIPGTPRIEPPEPPLLPMPTDVRGQNISLRAAEETSIGLPGLNYLIQTTFDGRPINGNDWQQLGMITIAPNEDPAVLTATQSFVVPDGRIAIVRKITWTSNQVLALPSIVEGDLLEEVIPMFLKLGVSGFTQRTYSKIFQQEGNREVYAIGFPGETFDVTVTSNPDFIGSIVGYEPSFFIEMYGNLLDIRGREKQYEPANVYSLKGRLQ